MKVHAKIGNRVYQSLKAGGPLRIRTGVIKDIKILCPYVKSILVLVRWDSGKEEWLNRKYLRMSKPEKRIPSSSGRKSNHGESLLEEFNRKRQRGEINTDDD